MTKTQSGRAYLLDTNVVSETRRARPDQRVSAYLKSIREERVCLSCLTIGELVKGAEARRRAAPDHYEELTRWIASIEGEFRDRILVVDDEAARIWGRLSALRPRPIVDTLIAATAIVHGMTLVTRNVADVRDTGVALIDPWAA